MRFGSRNLAGRSVPSWGINRTAWPALKHADSATSAVVTPGASNATGGWIELIAATAADAQYIQLGVTRTKYANAQTNSVLMDVAVGAAASEVAIASSIVCGGRGTAGGVNIPANVTLPVRVPKGSRLSVRLTSDYVTPLGATVWVSLFDTLDGRRVSPASLRSYGAVTASSKGVSVTTDNTWTEISSATTEAYQAIVCTAGGYDNVMTTAVRTVTFGTGASGSEQTILVMGGYTTSNEEVGFSDGISCVGGHFPAGVRLAAKVSDGATNAISVVMLGVPYG